MRALAFALLIAALAPRATAAPSVCSYQGELRVDGQLFSGSADFKFAIVCGGTTTLWSNDGTSANGSEPTDPIILDVAGGIFSVLLGDPELAMLPVTADLLTGCAEPALRVWVDTGAGFEQLSDLPFASSPVALVSDIASRATSGFTVEGNDLVVKGGNAVTVADAGNTTTAYLDGADGTVGCEVLKFGDGTSMATAALGGADNDWIVNGSNMSAGVSGNVGVGASSPTTKLTVDGGSDILSNLTGGFLRLGATTATHMLLDQNEVQAVNNGAIAALALNAEGGNVGVNTLNPAANLHVVGDLRADGTNGNGIDTRNPNVTSAILRLGWLNDVARIRIGGSGLGSNGGLDIQGTSDASLLRILNNGDATLSGNLTVQGTISTPNATGSLTIGPFGFAARESNTPIRRYAAVMEGTTVGQQVIVGCPLLLPVGATVTKCELFLKDASAAEEVTFSMLRVQLHPVPIEQTLAYLISSGAPGQTVLMDAGLNVLVSDAYTYSAMVQWSTPAAPADIRITGLRVTYTMP